MEAEDLDKRTGLFKALSEKTITVDCEPSEDMSVRLGLAVTMAGEMARELKVELDRDAAQSLAGKYQKCRAGAHPNSNLKNWQRLRGERKRITRADVEALVISDQKYSVWELSGMLATGDRQRAMIFLESLFPRSAELRRLEWSARWPGCSGS